MALSNITKEPRRELIESALGYLALIPLPLIWYYMGMFFYRWDTTDTPGGRIAAGIVGPPVIVGLAMLAVLVLYLVLFLIPHKVGEGVSAFLTEHGWDPRPEIRWKNGHPNSVVYGRLDFDLQGMPITDIPPKVVLARLKAKLDPRTGEPLDSPAAKDAQKSAQLDDIIRQLGGPAMQQLTNVQMATASVYGPPPGMADWEKLAAMMHRGVTLAEYDAMRGVGPMDDLPPSVQEALARK